MSDPFCVTIRRYIPGEAYQSLKKSQRQFSLIQQQDLTLEKIGQRLSALLDFEHRLGFVYVGERRWLEFLLSAGDLDTEYAKWVALQMNEVIFPDGLDYSDDATLGTCWSAVTQELSVFASFPELKENAIEYGFVELAIPGDASGPDMRRMAQSFEILHDLPYYLQRAGEYVWREEAWREEDVRLAGIAIEREPGKWRLRLLNEYGSLGAIIFQKETIVGLNP